MKKITYIFVLCGLFLSVSCQELFNEKDAGKLYEEVLAEVVVDFDIPAEYEDVDRSGLTVTFTDMNNGNSYTGRPAADGKVALEIPKGKYRIAGRGKAYGASEVILFNGISEGVDFLAQSNSHILKLLTSTAGTIIIKEVYSGGCVHPNPPPNNNGTWQMDKYVILYNNSPVVQYIDGICLGYLDPGNSNQYNVWNIPDPVTGEVPDWGALSNAAWQIPGDGTAYPLAPGGQAVIVINGAVDHTVNFPGSVNLNKAEYFVTYDPVAYPQPGAGDYHPTPGSNIRQERYLQLLRKLHPRVTSYSLPISSPATLIFRMPAELGDIRTYINDDANVVSKSGESTGALYMKLPFEWIMDGVDIYRGDYSTNYKRFSPTVDAGYATLSKTGLSRTVYRNVDVEETLAIPENAGKIIYGYAWGNDPSGIDAEASIRNGARIVYMETNNSTVDFHERSIQSLSNR